MEPTHAPSRVASPRNASLDNLRAFVTALVITHHAILAYFPYAPPLGSFDGSLGWGAFPIVDVARGKGLDILVLWNDTFFMALMFLLSGLFVGPSFARKGAGRFFRDRLLRLGLPFMVGAFVLAPLAYYPAYLERAGATHADGFWSAWLSLGSWPAGPAWFLWVLLVFGAVIAGIYRLYPAILARLERAGAWCRVHSTATFFCLLAAAIPAYLLPTRTIDPGHWSFWGPFFVQTARVPLYALYFAFGVLLGAGGGLNRDLVAPDGQLARRWVWWQVVAGTVFAAFVVALVMSMTRNMRGTPDQFLNILATVLFSATGAASSFCLLSYFARRCGQATPRWSSLSRNAYGMYVIHYGIVSWLQYGLLSVSLPGLVKALIVTVTAIAASWMITAALRRIPWIDRVI